VFLCDIISLGMHFEVGVGFFTQRKKSVFYLAECHCSIPTYINTKCDTKAGFNNQLIQLKIN